MGPRLWVALCSQVVFPFEFERLVKLTRIVPVLANHISLCGDAVQLDSKGSLTAH